MHGVSGAQSGTNCTTSSRGHYHSPGIWQKLKKKIFPRDRNGGKSQQITLSTYTHIHTFPVSLKNEKNTTIEKTHGQTIYRNACGLLIPYCPILGPRNNTSAFKRNNVKNKRNAAVCDINNNYLYRVNNSHVGETKYLVNKNLLMFLKLQSTSRYTVFGAINLSFSKTENK